METTPFKQNYNNKLNCMAFSTLRLRNDAKYKVDSIHEITNRGMVSFPAKIIEVKHVFLHQLTEGMCYLDTGYSRRETIAMIKKMFPHANFNQKQLSWILYKRLTTMEMSKQQKLNLA